MPGRDGTGPLGLGPLTGRGLGPCGRGLAFRRGFGAGNYYRKGLELTREEKIKILKAEKEAIEKELSKLEA